MSEVKVASLSGYIAEHSAYHHGDQSLCQTIVGMAQNFVGSNNVNLLLPLGQFGTRHSGGKDAASARYIYTALSKVARALFRPEDDPLLEYQIEEGEKIEPKWYLPILPLILVNGSEGIGTGWRTSIPNYDPREIVENLKRKMRGEPLEKMAPWFKHFKGKIVVSEKGKKKGFTNYGIIEVKDEQTVVIKELPIRKWISDYKMFLEKNTEGGIKEAAKSKKEGKGEKGGKKKKGKGGNGQKAKKRERKGEKRRWQGR